MRVVYRTAQLQVVRLPRAQAGDSVRRRAGTRYVHPAAVDIAGAASDAEAVLVVDYVVVRRRGGGRYRRPCEVYRALVRAGCRGEARRRGDRRRRERSGGGGAGLRPAYRRLGADLHVVGDAALQADYCVGALVGAVSAAVAAVGDVSPTPAARSRSAGTRIVRHG